MVVVVMQNTINRLIERSSSKIMDRANVLFLLKIDNVALIGSKKLDLKLGKHKIDPLLANYHACAKCIENNSIRLLQKGIVNNVVAKPLLAAYDILSCS